MHRLFKAVGRRSAGIAAGVVLTGGLAGGVLLTPGTAYASAADTVSITSATVSGTAVTVDVSVTPSSSTAAFPTGTVHVSATPGGGGCDIWLAEQGMTNVSGGDCTISGLEAGSYTLTAYYDGLASGPSYVKIMGSAPQFVADSPSPTATAGQNYSYTFQAVGSPEIRYSLNGGFPGMEINRFTGTVSGIVPNFENSFSYSVTATNDVGSATTIWFTVHVIRHVHHNHANIQTFLSCTSKVFTGQRGHCTLYVTNRGFGSAQDVSAQIALPKPLRAKFCGLFFNDTGCTISHNTASENLGTLAPGQTEQLTVVFVAKTGFALWGWHHGSPFTVKVVGSASSFDGFPFFQQSVSFSTAFVTIIPRGWWA